jgi:hypothetical protein
MKRIITLTIAGLALFACSSPNEGKVADAATTTKAADTTEIPATTAKPKPKPTTTTAEPTTTTVACPPGKHSIGKTCIDDVAAAPPTTAAPKEGTRTNPLSGAALTGSIVETLSITGLAPGDWGAIFSANRFNDPAPEGQFYAKLTYTAKAKSTITEPVSHFDIACDLVGTKGKVYEQSFLSDSSDDGALHLLSDQPDIVGGGSMSGDVYYLVDLDDTGLLALCDGTYVLPA